MYSYEIRQLLEAKQYLVSIKEYEQIIKSPQVDHVIYKNQQFYIWTTDGYEFKLQIRKERLR
jgi:uncharacterized protein YjbK